jgi:NAD(P)-dependent dehydrogenase (short-subunit alcohol dehydrogenase family)
MAAVDINGSVVVVTGAASGIGRALARRFATEGAAMVVAADLDGAGATAVAEEIGGRAVELDASDESSVIELIETTESGIGPIELWCGNAGIGGPGGVESTNEDWNRMWDVNLMAHVIAARHLIPRWEARGSGHLLITASAAGLLTSLGTAPYAVTKHAAVALAEWIAITHGDDGVRVSCLCPQGVRTAMTEPGGAMSIDQVEALGMIDPEDVASVVVDGLSEDRFLILPHPEVVTYEQRRAGDRERWLGGMRKMQRSLLAGD